MKKSGYIDMILLMMIPILSSAHHLLDAWPPVSVDWFFLIDLEQDLQWYIKDMGIAISRILLLSILYRNIKEKLIKKISLVLCVFSIIDLIGYWLCYLQYNHIVMAVALAICAIEFTYVIAFKKK